MGADDSQRQTIQERAFDFACRIVKLHGFLTKRGSSQRRLAGQLLRSGTSVGAKLQEAHAAQSKSDFISKCSIALKEARETYYWLRLLVACDVVTSERLTPLVAEANEIVAILTTIVRNARSSHIKD
jgi:four helix bundle protein